MPPPVLSADQFTVSRFDHSTRSRVYDAELAVERINDNVIDISSNLNTLGTLVTTLDTAMGTRVDKNRLFYVTVDASFEKDQGGSPVLNYGSDSNVKGAFGIPLLRNCKLNGYRAISNKVAKYEEGEQTEKTIHLPIQFYSEDGTLLTGDNAGLKVKLRKSLDGDQHTWEGFRSKIGSNTLLDRGSRLSLSTPSSIGDDGLPTATQTANDLKIKDDTQFRIVFEFLSLEDSFLGYPSNQNQPNTFYEYVADGYIANDLWLKFDSNDVSVTMKYKCESSVALALYGSKVSNGNPSFLLEHNTNPFSATGVTESEVTFIVTGDDLYEYMKLKFTSSDNTKLLTISSLKIDGIEYLPRTFSVLKTVPT